LAISLLQNREKQLPTFFHPKESLAWYPGGATTHWKMLLDFEN